MKTQTSMLLLAAAGTHAYLLPPSGRHEFSSVCSQRRALGRREWISGALGGALGGAAIALAPQRSEASGGATAGKTTSIPRAKIRYYGRVSSVLNEFNIVGKVIAAGDADKIKGANKFFFSEVDDAPFPELKSAGYLLAVAFKIDSKIPPDKIVAVKLYKKMMTDVEKLGKEMSSGKADRSAKAYAVAKVSMEAYLEEVELPELSDPRYNDPGSACFFKCDANEGRVIGGG